MCALRWTDVDVARGILTVERSFAQTAGVIHEKATKTRQKRRVALDTHTVELLVAYQEQCTSECELLDVDLPRDAFVFSGSPDGSTPVSPSTVSQRYRRLAIRLGLRSSRIHALRHYSATELLTTGVDLRTVAGRLGHASGGATTLRFYAAWVDEADRRAADAIAGLMPRPNPALRQPRSPYERLAADLRVLAIERGQLAPGAPLPTAIELAAQHNVSAGTVSRAIRLLREAGLVTASRGKRATVAAEMRGLELRDS